MPHDDGRMTETCCGNDIRRGEEEMLRWWTHNCFVNYTHATGSNTVITTMCDYLSSLHLLQSNKKLKTVYYSMPLMMVVWPKHVVAVTSEKEKKICCVDGPIITLLINTITFIIADVYWYVSIGRPLWREDGAAIFSVITEWSESLRTRNHTLLSSENSI
jgi:hypothetical protein